MNFKHKAIDLFSGCGGVSCGLALAGFKVVAAVEIDENAVETYKSYPLLSDVNVLNEDICKLSGKKILEAAGIEKDEIYLLAGCPPCQNFSRQNPENKNKSEENRKRLLFEFLRIIEELNPPFVLMENVPGIKIKPNKAILDEFLEKLSKTHAVTEGVLNSADYGVPQLRKRFVLHAARLDINEELQGRDFFFGFPQQTHYKSAEEGQLKWKTVKDAIGDLPSIEAGQKYPGEEIHNHKCAGLSELNLKRMQIIRKNGRSRTSLPEDLVLPCHKKKDAEGNVFMGHKDVYGIMDADKPAPTITGGCLCYSKGRYGHYEQDRAISVREAARLQTFPDDFIFSDSMTVAALQIGNAVPIDLVRASGTVMKKAMYTVKRKRSRG
jgi:DNA (cytosine-5)-methyltransferase 1